MVRNLSRALYAPEVVARRHAIPSCLIPVRDIPASTSEMGQGSGAKCEESASRDLTPDPSSLTPAFSRSPGILVIDDDFSMRTLLNVGLEYHGFLVWLAADGRQALEIYRKQRTHIDLVLLDVRMPEMDGPSTLVALQRINPEVCCFFMSADAGIYTREELLERGAVRVIRKPFHLSEVAHLLWQLVKPLATELAGRDHSMAAEEDRPEMFLG
jgi:CheY-like chemotaxis protein